MAGGLSTIGTTLKAGAAAASLKQLCRIKSYPQLGGEPEQIETTDLEDRSQTFVPGVQAVEAMSFTVNYDKAKYDELKESEGTDQIYELNFGENGKDGAFSWKGQHSVFVNEGEVNGLREMTISITPSTEITPKKATEAFPASANSSLVSREENVKAKTK